MFESTQYVYNIVVIGIGRSVYFVVEPEKKWGNNVTFSVVGVETFDGGGAAGVEGWKEFHVSGGGGGNG